MKYFEMMANKKKQQQIYDLAEGVQKKSSDIGITRSIQRDIDQGYNARVSSQKAGGGVIMQEKVETENQIIERELRKYVKDKKLITQALHSGGGMLAETLQIVGDLQRIK